MQRNSVIRSLIFVLVLLFISSVMSSCRLGVRVAGGSGGVSVGVGIEEEFEAGSKEVKREKFEEKAEAKEEKAEAKAEAEEEKAGAKEEKKVAKAEAAEEKAEAREEKKSKAKEEKPQAKADKKKLTKKYWKDLGVDMVGPATPPPFTLKHMNGTNVSLDQYKGKVVFLNFWASWCGPCKAEMPAMNNLYKNLKDKGFVMLAVNDSEKKDVVSRYLSNKGFEFDVLFDPVGETAIAYKAFMLPLTFIIDQDGQVVGQALGGRQWDSPVSIKLFEELLER